MSPWAELAIVKRGLKYLTYLNLQTEHLFNSVSFFVLLIYVFLLICQLLTFQGSNILLSVSQQFINTVCEIVLFSSLHKSS